MKPIREWPPNRHGALALSLARAGRWFALSGLRRSDADDTRLTDCLPLRGIRLGSERRRYISIAECRLVRQPLVKARNGGEAAARPEHGGGRVWRAGTRSGYGRPGGPGFFGGAVAVVERRGRGSGCGCGPDPALCEKHSHTVLDGRYSASDGTVYMPSLGGVSG
jgi:hypothetical protein